MQKSTEQLQHLFDINSFNVCDSLKVNDVDDINCNSQSNLCCVGAVLSVKVIDSLSHCLSLAADGSLRRWSLVNGQQLSCILEAVPVDSAPSSVHLHVSEQKQLLSVYTRTQVISPLLLHYP